VLAGDEMKNFACCAKIFRFDEEYELTHDVVSCLLYLVNNLKEVNLNL